MFHRVEVLGRMTIGRIVAAADVTTLEAKPQVYPLVPGFQTFLATVRGLRLDIADLREMLALLGHDRKLFPRRVLFKA